MNRIELLDGVRLAMPGVAKGDLVEQFSCLSINGDTVRSTDGRIFVRVRLKSDTRLKAVVPGKLLYSILNSISPSEIDMKMDGQSLHITANKLDSKITTPEISGTPIADEIIKEPEDEKEWIEVGPGLLQALKLCKFSCSRDQTTGVLTGVHVTKDSAFSCDRYRISKANLQQNGLSEPFTVPVNLIEEVEKHEGKITHFHIRNNIIMFKGHSGALIIGGSLIEGSYPQFDRFFVDFSQHPTILLPEDIAAALSRQNLVLEGMNIVDKQTIVTFVKDGLELRCASAAGKIDEKVEVQVPETLVGKSFPINPVFWADILDLSRDMTHVASEKMLVFKNAHITHLVKTKE